MVGNRPFDVMANRCCPFVCRCSCDMDAIAVGSKPRLSHHSVFSNIGFELINMGYINWVLPTFFRVRSGNSASKRKKIRGRLCHYLLRPVLVLEEVSMGFHRPAEQ